MVKTAELEARGRDPDCLRFGGMSLREGARAGGAASVEYLVGTVDTFLRRGLSVGDGKAALRGCPSPTQIPRSRERLCASHFIVDVCKSLHRWHYASHFIADTSNSLHG
jgi:hypothetical protein